ncbi:MAG: archease [Thermoplasmata archaeon]|nr:archease [Thermoplasmata archaeon]
MVKEGDKGYTIIDHTADIGLEACGRDLDEAFENAAKGMFDILSDNSDIGSERSLEVRIESDNLEELLVDYLTKLLYLYEVEGILFTEFRVEIRKAGEGFFLEGTAFGEPFDPTKHNYPLEIKAVTYHMLEVRESPACVRVVFDL